MSGDQAATRRAERQEAYDAANRAEWNRLVGKVDAALVAAGADGITPSAAAGRAGTDTYTAHAALDALVGTGHAVRDDHGAWTRWYPR